MSRSPERISSYRRHFEDASTSSYQVRVSSPSPVRRDVGRCRSASYTRSDTAVRSSMAVGRRTISSSRSQPLMTGGGMGAVCLSGGGPAVDLEQAAAQNREFLSTRTTERQEMVLLNDRLAAYIEKVRSLEQQNKLLETEIEVLKNRFLKPTGLRLLYEEQLKELKRLADQMRVQRDLAIGAKDAMASQLEMMKVKYEEALEMRRKAELDIEAFRPDVDAATSERIALEKQLENLEVELEFLQRVHKQEIDELMKQIYAAHASAMDVYSLPDLSNALKQIQHQYDDIAAKNLQEMDSWYKTKFDDLNNKSTRHVDHVRSVREGIVSAKKDIQNKERDFDTLKTKNEALEAQIRETQEKYRKELEELQARIEALQLELKSSKQKTALLLREYQDLLNVKMSLEIEITTYRKLIEGEDSRLSSMVQSVQTMSLMSGSTSVHTSGVAGVADRMGGGLTGGLGDGLATGLRGGLGVGVATGLREGVGGGAATGFREGVGSDTATGLREGVGGGTATGLREGVGGGIATGLGGGVGSGLATGVGGGLAGDPAKGLAEGLGGGLTGGIGGSATGFGGGQGGDPAKGLGGGLGSSLATGLGGGQSGDPAKGLGAGLGGGPATGLGGGLGGGPATGLGGGLGGGPVTGFGAGNPGGIGGIGGGLVNGITGGVGGLGTTVDYSQAQAVEMMERKTVLIRTVKTEDDILECNTQEKSYSISGAADVEE